MDTQHVLVIADCVEYFIRFICTIIVLLLLDIQWTDKGQTTQLIHIVQFTLGLLLSIGNLLNKMILNALLNITKCYGNWIVLATMCTRE